LLLAAALRNSNMAWSPRWSRYPMDAIGKVLIQIFEVY
jgi:hypothetical protein